MQGQPTLLAVRIKSRSVVRTSCTPGFSTLITTSLLLPRSTAACTCGSRRHRCTQKNGRAMLAVSTLIQHCDEKCCNSSTQLVGMTARAMLAAQTSLLGGDIRQAKHLPCNAIACAINAWLHR